MKLEIILKTFLLLISKVNFLNNKEFNGLILYVLLVLLVIFLIIKIDIMEIFFLQMIVNW